MMITDAMTTINKLFNVPMDLPTTQPSAINKFNKLSITKEQNYKIRQTLHLAPEPLTLINPPLQNLPTIPPLTDEGY